MGLRTTYKKSIFPSYSCSHNQEGILMMQNPHSLVNKTLLSVTVLFLFTTALEVSAREPGAYSTDSTIGGNYSDWMAMVPDRTLISTMSIPGTHETMAQARAI